MSLSTALNIANASLTSNATESSVLSRNIANVNTANYSRKIANLTTNVGGAGEVTSVTNATNDALFANLLGANSTAAAQQAMSDGLTQFQTTVGSTTQDQSPSALISALSTALQTYEASPSTPANAQGAVSAAKTLATALNNDSTIVQNVRESADSSLASAVKDVNALLSQFQSVNTSIIAGQASGADVTSDLDTRNTILSQLSQDIGIQTIANSNGGMSIYTDSGVTLFDTSARTVTFAPTAAYTPGTTGNAVYVDGVAVTGASAVMPTQSGKIAGFADLRDTLSVQYQSQLDQIAAGLINSFAETDQSGGGGPALPGLFTVSGATSLPSTSTVTTGLATQIKINPAVDPSQGGNLDALRDGGMNGADYVYNTNAAASYTARLQGILTSLSSNQNFDPSASSDTVDSVGGYANASESWLEAQRQLVSNQLDYSNTLVSQSTSALSSATGVNLDTEMSQMLDLEHSYQASAQLMTTIGQMFTALFTALQNA